MVRGMKLCILTGIVAVVTALQCVAQTDDDVRVITLAAGVERIEEMDEYELERLIHLLEKPVRINVEGPGKLVDSGLLTRYQAASLADYRIRHGDVLSAPELAMVDGFTPSLVELVRPFISFDSFKGVDLPAYGRVKCDAAIRTSAHTDDTDTDYAYSTKFRVSYGNVASGNVSFSRSYGAVSARPELKSFNMSCNFPGVGLEFFLGDFNARFGQGLVMWNGMSMSGVNSPSSSRKNAPGLSATWSFSGSSALTGAAARWNAGHWTASAAVAFPQLKKYLWVRVGNNFLPMLNIAWYGTYGQFSVTHISEMSGTASGGVSVPDMKTSVDMQMCIRGVNLYGEVAYDWVNRTFASLAGGDWGVGDNGRLGVHLRYYPAIYLSSWSSAVRTSTKCSNEYGLCFSGESSHGLFSLDAAYHPVPKVKDASSSIQIKAQLRWMPSVGEFLKMDFRVTERWRSWGTPFRTDLRADASVDVEGWTFSSRVNLLKCIGYGMLVYLDESWKNERFSVHVRQGAFRIDEWDDRIYVYERDAPGSFTVPAFYGRGLWTSAYAGWRFWRHGRVYLRMFYVTYPFMPVEKRKPGKAELRVQFAFSF